MSAAHKYLPHYTVAEYKNWEGDWELWQGIPVSMSPSPFGPHQRTAKNFVFELESQIRSQSCQANVLYEIDWIVSSDTVVRPDVIVVCGDAPQRHVEQTPDLIVEVQSESTAQRDREAKRELYFDEGVGVYLIANPTTQSLDAYLRESSTLWTANQVADQIEVSICDDCNFKLSRESVFR